MQILLVNSRVSIQGLGILMRLQGPCPSLVVIMKADQMSELEMRNCILTVRVLAAHSSLLKFARLSILLGSL
jgi:hypothetical protein